MSITKSFMDRRLIYAGALAAALLAAADGQQMLLGKGIVLANEIRPGVGTGDMNFVLHAFIQDVPHLILGAEGDLGAFILDVGEVLILGDL